MECKYNGKKLDERQKNVLLDKLKIRFENNMHRHLNLSWYQVEERLKQVPDKLWSLHQMEEIGGEPDVVSIDSDSSEIIFYDCSLESPKGRRSLCYDREALNSRKEHKPISNAVDEAEVMGVELLTEEQYKQLQSIEHFDLKTSSWVKTPDDIRVKGGAIFVIVVMDEFSLITMVLNLIIQLEDFVVC